MNAALLDQAKRTRHELTQFFEAACQAYGGSDVIEELMAYRGYTDPAMRATLEEVGVFRVDYLSDLLLMDASLTTAEFRRWGLLTDTGEYLMPGRYVLPIRGIDGLVCALVGWDRNGGARKYVTTPTFGFSRDATFFNFDSYKDSMARWGGVVFLVEGIFDGLALRSLGFPAIGNQGLELSGFKSQMLSRYTKVVAIPDNDTAGRALNPYLRELTGKKPRYSWDMNVENVFVLLPQGVKDIDIFVRDFDCYEDLKGCINSKLFTKLKEDIV